MAGEALGLIGIALEIGGVALAALEYSGRETLPNAQRWVRDHIRLRYSPSDFDEKLEKNELSLKKTEPVADRVAFAVATSTALAFLVSVILVAWAVRLDRIVAPLGLAYVWVAKAYWSLLPPPAWTWGGIVSIVLIIAIPKKRAQTRLLRLVGKTAALVLSAAILPVALVIVPYGWAYQWAAKRAYRAIHKSVSRAASLWDHTEQRSGKPLLLFAAVVVIMGLMLQGVGMLGD